MYAVVAAAGTVVQTAWLAYLPLAGGIAGPLLPIVMTVGLLHGSEEGAVVGGGIGLLHDVMSGAPLGLGMATGGGASGSPRDSASAACRSRARGCRPSAARCSRCSRAASP